MSVWTSLSLKVPGNRGSYLVGPCSTVGDFGGCAATGTTGTPGYLASRKDFQNTVRAGPEMSTLVRMRMTRGALGLDCFERELESFCGDEEVGTSRYAEREDGRWGKFL